MKKDAFYFPHDFNARNDKKLIKVKHKFRQSGIGIFWSIVEMLYEENGKLLLSDVPTIADDLREKEPTIVSIINDFELFENDGKYFWSNSVKRRIDVRLEKSEKAKASASHRWQNANGMRTHSDGNAIKERKGKERKVYTDPTIEEVVAYFLEKGYSEETARKAFDYYASNNWHDRNGDKVIAWKQKMIANWFKPENKIVNGSATVKKMIL